jgi:protein-L-isoaspartate(D-aspartate) O-methyltransferase
MKWSNSIAWGLMAAGLAGSAGPGPACNPEPTVADETIAPPGPTSSSEPAPDHFTPRRERMVAEQIEARGVKDPAVLAAMRRVPRHEFMPEWVRDQAYHDHALPIGYEQNISQPYVVAYMTEALKLQPGDKVLEIGTGSGYQAAVLAEITDRVYSIEIIKELADRARQDLDRLGYKKIKTRTGDGYRGWPEFAPFDAIIVTAAPDHVPPALVEQLKVGGRLVIPLGNVNQELRRLTRTETGVQEEMLLPVFFVPMTGEARERK